MVLINSEVLLSLSKCLRIRRIVTSTVRSLARSSRPVICLINCSRLKMRPGESSIKRSALYSPLGRRLASPFGDVKQRLFSSSSQPLNVITPFVSILASSPPRAVREIKLRARMVSSRGLKG